MSGVCSEGTVAGASSGGSDGLPPGSTGVLETVEEVNVSLAMRGSRRTIELLWLSYVTCDLLALAGATSSKKRCRSGVGSVKRTGG